MVTTIKINKETKDVLDKIVSLRNKDILIGSATQKEIVDELFRRELKRILDGTRS